MRAETRRHSMFCSTSADNMHVRWLCRSMSDQERLWVLVWGLQINSSELTNLQIHNPQIMRTDYAFTWVGIYQLLRGAPFPQPSGNKKDWVPGPAGASSTLCQLLGQHPCHTTCGRFWVGWWVLLPCPPWGRGEEVLPSILPLLLPHCTWGLQGEPEPHMHKGRWGDRNRRPPVTSLCQVLYQHLGKTPWWFGGDCFDLIFIYPSHRK